MKFYIFSKHERFYKVIAFSLVFIVTIACIYFYINLNNTLKSNELNILTFVLSLFYALLLFIIGIYLTAMQNKSGNLFYRRKQQYRYLKSLRLSYSGKFTLDVDAKTLHHTIIFLQILTGRIDSDKKVPIPQDGFEFTNKYLKLEKTFLEYRASLDKIDSKKQPDQDTDFKPKKSKYKSVEKKVKNYHLNIVKRVDKNIIKIEKVYGERLTVSLQDEDSLTNNLLILERLLNEVKSSLLDYEDIEQVAQECSNHLKRDVESIILQLVDRVENCTDTLQNIEMKLKEDNDIL
ncbi:hypothetical protein EL84_14070 [Paenibacillus sp. VT-400]|uniref:hypothetical protein n=1 Tax=Paenibacillus sp. VT-400 TaxID=1495853 RepID=UPI00064AE1B7|nr:hypothetical protein [Paenibacillus sp. VT-400]KLU53417.1 hypothetical protein EL84_14070 [Paenibacillus sp. VT-400]